VKCDDVSRDNPCILELDDIKRLEGILKEFNFSSWKSVLDMAEGYGINSASITSYVRKADPAAGLSAVSGFMWGAVLALKAKAIDPVNGAVWVARGLGNFALRNSTAHRSGFAEGYGKLVSILLHPWISPMAVICSRIPDGLVGSYSKLVTLVAELRGRTWDIIIVCREENLSKGMRARRDCLFAEVEFTREPGWLRVKRSSVAQRTRRSPPVVYPVSTVEEGVAVLTFEQTNLCIALSEPDAALFAHPVAGLYTKDARQSGRLIRAAAMDLYDGTAVSDNLLSQITSYMIDMYADMRLYGLHMDTAEMMQEGFPEISGIGAIEATMVCANLVSAALKRSGDFA